MKTFRLKADATCEAENIDDAFIKLAEHLHRHLYDLASGEPAPASIFTSGEIEIAPDVDEEPSHLLEDPTRCPCGDLFCAGCEDGDEVEPVQKMTDFQ